MDESKRYAVIIGVSQYNEGQIGSLPCAKNDAIRLAQDLINFGQFKTEQVYLLTDEDASSLGISRNEPTRTEILHKIHYVAENASENDLILLYFAGHGVEISKNPYLLASDTKMDVLAATGIKVTDINQELESSKAKSVIRIFDACRSAFGETRGIMDFMTRGFQDAILKTGKGWASFSSCSTGECALEAGDLNHGVFTYYLCEGLEGKAANDNGEVTFERLVDFVKTSVGNWCDSQSRKQTPHVQTDLSGIVVLTHVKKKKEVEPIPSGNPLELLHNGIERHLSSTPQDIRHLVFTDQNQMEKAVNNMIEVTKRITEEFHNPSISITVSKSFNLPKVEQRIWSQCLNDFNSQHLRTEFVNDFSYPSTIRLEFSSNEVALPNTLLFISVLRFSFCYWIWYMHDYKPTNIQTGFNAKPRFKSGFLTFKPKAIMDEIKVENSIKELFKRMTEDFLEWANQLKEYANQRIDPLRKIDSIID